MFDAIKNKGIQLALNAINEKYIGPNLAGIGKITEIAYRDKKLFLTLQLDGMENRPAHICASDIKIEKDGSRISVGQFESDMAFIQNALNRFATRPFDIPEGAARIAVSGAAKLL